MKVLGLHNGHNANLCAVENGRLLAHYELDKVLRKKNFGFDCVHMNELLEVAISRLLPDVGWTEDSVDLVALSSLFGPHGDWSRTELGPILGARRFTSELSKPWIAWKAQWRGRTREFLAVTHHLCHMAYAYFSSPFSESAVLALDGWGDFDTSTTIGQGRGVELDYLFNLTSGPPEGVSNNSIGLNFFWLGKILPFLGSSPLDVPGKAMGLASYGEPRDSWRPTVARYLRTWPYHRSLPMQMAAELQLPLSDLDSPEKQPARDLLATIQEEAERYLLDLSSVVKRETGSEHLCLAGGCALNIHLNSALLRRSDFSAIHVPPACSDTGNALGAALYASHHLYRIPRDPVSYSCPFRGSAIRIHERIGTHPGISRLDFDTPNDTRLPRLVAELLARKTIGGVARGRSEIGPRALGHRSILASACDPTAVDRVNKLVKKREHWRPFAPLCLEERAHEWFEDSAPSPYMLFSFSVRPDRRSRIPAVTHVDGTARVQTVRRDFDWFIHETLFRTEELTGVPLLLNTSLNVAGAPMCDDADEIITFFLDSSMDFLVLEQTLLAKPSLQEFVREASA